MLNAHYKKELLDYLYDRKTVLKKDIYELEKIKDFDNGCSEVIRDAKKESKEQLIYVLDCIINKYLHIQG